MRPAMVLPCTTVAKILVHGWIATAVIMGIVFVSSHAAAPPLRCRFARLPLLRALSRGLSQRAASADPEQRHAYTYKCAAPRPRRRRLGFTPGRRPRPTARNGALTARSLCAGLSRNRSGGRLRRGRQLGRLLHNHPRAGRRQQRLCSGPVRPSRPRTASPRLTVCLRLGTTSSTGTRC